jgi:hypothetical protein
VAAVPRLVVGAGLAAVAVVLRLAGVAVRLEGAAADLLVALPLATAG